MILFSDNILEEDIKKIIEEKKITRQKKMK